MGQGDHGRGRETRVTRSLIGSDDAPPLPVDLAGAGRIHSCCAAKPAVVMFGWRWLFLRIRKQQPDIA